MYALSALLVALLATGIAKSGGVLCFAHKEPTSTAGKRVNKNPMMVGLSGDYAQD